MEKIPKSILGVSAFMSEVVLKMAFIKNYENIEELQNILGNFRCLLYAHHVNTIGVLLFVGLFLMVLIIGKSCKL